MASGSTLAVFNPGANEPPSSSYATFDTRNAHPVLDFDAAAVEIAYFSGVMPSQYAGGGITVDVNWMATSATSGDVVWGVSYEELDPNHNDLDSDNFGTETTGAGTANATSGKTTKTSLAISHANCGSPAAGDAFRIKLRRVATDGGDTMAGDAELVELGVRET